MNERWLEQTFDRSEIEAREKQIELDMERERLLLAPGMKLITFKPSADWDESANVI